MIKINRDNVSDFVSIDELNSFLPRLLKAHETLVNGTGVGADFLGWLTLPENVDTEELSRIKLSAKKIRENSDVLLIIGIGGSYLGARAAIEFIKGSFPNQRGGEDPEVYFVGNNLSTDYINEVINIIGERDFSINVISKSGSSTEPGIAFRIFKALLEKKYGKDAARERVFVTTDKVRGALKRVADNEGYETFVIPDDIGGRYSVLTAVGLFPMAAAGIDVDAALRGAKKASEELVSTKSLENPAWTYTACRNIMYKKGKKVEVLAYFEPRLRFMAEWWKQLFGESEGKDGLGIFPASVELSTDLHSIGQYIQDGERMLQETFVLIGKPKDSIVIPENDEDFDGFNYIAGRDIAFVNENAHKGTAIAHRDGKTPNMTIELSGSDAECFGYLVYFFEFSCALSGYVLGVNPFNQPGVEAYKKNMFALLGKPGYEDRRKEILGK